MDKWLSSESGFKRATPATTPSTQGDNTTPIEETKKIYESSSIEELRNRLSSQLKKKDTKKRTLRNALLVMATLTSVMAVGAVFLMVRVGVLQGQNQNLKSEIEGLHSQIQSLESENKSIQAKIDAAEKDRNGLRDTLRRLTLEKESTEEELRKNQTLFGNANEEKTYLEEILINKTKEIEELKKNAAVPAQVPVAVAALGPVSSDIQKLSQQLKDKDTEIQRLSDQNRILSNRIEKLYKVTNDKIAAINVAKMTLEQTIAEARKNIDSEWHTVDLGSIQAAGAVPSTTGAATPKPPTSPALRKEGRVLAINEEHGFVVVDLGKTNGIEPTSVLTLKQRGETVGTLTPLEIRDVMTACNIKNLKSGRKIALNDPVLIQS